MLLSQFFQQCSLCFTTLLKLVFSKYNSFVLREQQNWHIFFSFLSPLICWIFFTLLNDYCQSWMGDFPKDIFALIIIFTKQTNCNLDHCSQCLKKKKEFWVLSHERGIISWWVMIITTDYLIRVENRAGSKMNVPIGKISWKALPFSFFSTWGTAHDINS